MIFLKQVFLLRFHFLQEILRFAQNDVPPRGESRLRDFCLLNSSLSKGEGWGEGFIRKTTSISLIVHFFFFISTKKEKAEPKKKNTNDKMARVIRGFRPRTP